MFGHLIKQQLITMKRFFYILARIYCRTKQRKVYRHINNERQRKGFIVISAIQKKSQAEKATHLYQLM